MRAALLLALAACGGATPAPPARPTTAAETVALLEEAADRACTCTDHDCAVGVAQDLDVLLAAPTPSLLDDPAFPRANAAIVRGIDCLWAHEVVGYAYAQLSIQTYATFRDHVCACTDVACAIDYSTSIATRIRRLRATPTRDHVETELTALDDAATACIDGLVDAEPLVRALVEIRDRACTCTPGDLACLHAAAAASEAWRAEWGATQINGLESRRLRELTADAEICLARGGWKP